MHNIRNSGILTVFLVTVASPAAFGQDRAIGETENCDRVLAVEDLAAGYRLELSNLMMSIAGFLRYENDGDTLDVTMWSVGTTEVVLSGLPERFGDVTLQFAGADEPDWHWDDDNEIVGVTDRDMELMLGCDIERLPRLVGTFEGLSEDGYPMHHVMRLMVFDMDWIWGQWQWTADTAQGPVVGTRSMSFDRLE